MATAKIIDDRRFVKRLSSKKYPKVSVRPVKVNVSINETLPFRVRLTNIGIPGYGQNNPAPIGIAIIGYNNYIL
jgi:hypothetical protein